MGTQPAHVPSGTPATDLFHPGSTVSPEVLHALESQYGKKGAAAFAVFIRGEADLEAYGKRFNRYYKSGRIGLSFDKIPAELIAESPHLAKVAFDAGVRDAKETTGDSFTALVQKGYTGKITEANGLPEELLKPDMLQEDPYDLLNHCVLQRVTDDANKIRNNLEKVADPVYTGNLKLLEVRSPNQANNEWFIRGYDKSPYSPDYEVKIVQAGNEEYVRVFSYNADGASNKLGGWFMRKGDIKGLTPAQIADKYALPTKPTHICDVIVRSEMELQTGIANSVSEWGKGGGQQFDTMGKRLLQSAFVNERLIGE